MPSRKFKVGNIVTINPTNSRSVPGGVRDVPVVLIKAQSGPENTAAGFAADVTDYLTKPFRPAHVRARVRPWLLRRPAGAPRDT